MKNGPPSLPSHERRVFANRTLNLRAIRAVGFDMDYTLVHYKIEQWEQRAYEHVQQALLGRGWPVGDLEFDPSFVTLGLCIDIELGNIVKSNRFGFITRATHGTQRLDFEDLKKTYSRMQVDPSEPRWVSMYTLFSLSEATLYAQLVDLLDAGELAQATASAVGYQELYRIVKSSLDDAHMEGKLKAEIVSDPARFVELDHELPLALLDLKHSGKSLLLITNSEWSYTRHMMKYSFDELLPGKMTWRDLFDIVIVQARKPAFFAEANPVFEVVDEEGLLRPKLGKLEKGGKYLGGHAGLVEESLDLPGEDILYFGDHVYSDVSVSKKINRWRTGLVVRELEAELSALRQFRPSQLELTALMNEKELLELEQSRLRLDLQRIDASYGPPPRSTPKQIKTRLAALRVELEALDQQIAPLARASGELYSERWGPLTRSGNDKSHFARQIEAHADAYTSRVSNLLLSTPFVYLRSPGGRLPHDN